MNIGLNITQNSSKFDYFLNRIKKHPYFNYSNLFLSPHISGNFPEYQSDMINQFIENLLRFLNYKTLKNRICKKRLY